MMLSGLKILDFSTLFPGPYATHILADLGAEVLRVTAPDRPDMLEHMPPVIAGISAAARTINRGKSSIELNLKDENGQARAKELIAEYDIVLEQFRPGVMAKFGLDFAVLSKVNPRLIYCSLSGYGQTGPMRDRAGHDINYLALSGLASYSGTQETGPVLSGAQIADAAGSHYTAIALLSAVIDRQNTGRGRYLDVAIADCALAMNAMFGAGGLATNTSPQPGREVLNGGHLYGYYQTQDGRWISVGCLEPKFAVAFFTAIGKPEWLARAGTIDPDTLHGLRADVAAVIAEQPLDHWRETFSQTDACVEPVMVLQEAREFEQFRSRGMFVTEVAGDREILQVGSPIR